ncbi:hypothetical protein EEW87_007280 [Janibacter melonis]|jgi:hypothetical protein|uniref:DUF4177 domain-containing protein n=1 Tax=Janibacter melonis TaxID=262209 RepID=A0A5P8FLV7_9MICO|nr:DUF5703 family protein [Janibacter melonis]MCB5990157.1 DUF5703 family protein [Janibacter melonis]QFQ30161.2 hypothetical protein EEW87_007280 [Janibacter melonis]
MVEYEFQVLSFPRETTRGQIRAALAEHAEYGRWELHRTVRYVGGQQRSWLRRKIIRVPRRDDPLGLSRSR